MKIDAVIIKNMSVPDSCRECPLAIMDHYGQQYCKLVDRYVTCHATFLGGRPYECPLMDIVIEIEED